jgi:thermostable 8-oxoguanine DNA glycosylase
MDFKKYVALYNVEEYLFNTVGVEIRKNGFLTFEDFYKIGMWKSARQKPNYLKNKRSVKSVTKKSFAIKDENLKIETLCSLSGVAIPTASAILTIAYPKRYAIIDIRCIEMLRKLGYSINKTITKKSWITYLNIVRSIAKDQKITPREVDKALFAMHRELLEKKHKNLYKKYQ